ncbi:MexX/AxyX family multidrug efflux RND transporter periplasmic adaptor subunit [Methylobacillus arboreus]|uniref:MexX/AxyX family multidrug efflux RND transporter periplasmic adaptor subunit n=1 Tax=Methylobacillus arboreus TaxID=755170 RepID=UPI001E6277D0|nr:MexX/AxyX family multidrug efflux RND transporter periplasmic adaptor subunit [Methylobacillus arboreus]MCB5189779.1 MexX/AxyX family multidrug efflux RND transporter periplasmic adaptor subunit [Methylobacillus arboreus]
MLQYRSYLGTIYLIAIVLFLNGCGKEPPQQEAETAPEVSVMTAELTSVTNTVTLPGRLEAYRQAEVRARVAGIVTERLYKEGQDVKKGTPLFLINPELLNAARDQASGTLAAAEAQYANAQDKLERYKDLATDQSISDRDYKAAIAEEMQAKAQLLTAKAQLDRANLDLSYSRVTSPIAGRARRALVTEGALVGQDAPTPLTTVEQLDPIYVNFSQPASEVMALQRAIKEGRMQSVAKDAIQVELVFPDGSVYKNPGKLFFSDMAVDSNTDTVAMRALFANPNYELLPGAYVQIRLEQAVNKNIVLVPRDALVRTSAGSSVMVIGQDSKVEARQVTAEAMQGPNWIVTDGLKGGEIIILTNPGMLAPGTTVKPKSEKKQGEAESTPEANQ